MTSACIVGLGNIGSRVYVMLKDQDVDVPFIVEYNGIYTGVKQQEEQSVPINKIDGPENYQDYFKKVDGIFLSIPTLDDGAGACNFIKSAVSLGKPIVTSEKGALSNYFKELKPYLGLIGYSATVGGGARLLRVLEDRCNPNILEIHAVVNGTLNYIFDKVSQGEPLTEAIMHARKLKYTEPGATDPLDVINKEANSDVPMKVSILFNMFSYYNGWDNRICAKDIECRALDEQNMKKLMKQALKRRFIVSITKEKNYNDVIGGFEHECDGWYICAGFKNTEENPLYKKLVIPEVNNTLLTYEGECGISQTTGPGAGPAPTANSMIIDFNNLVA